MKRKLIAIMLVTSLVFSMLSFVTVYTADDKVEIKFTVGDSTLVINGNSVTVEKPYVVGVGVTLVPVRVITEAFGAQVNWIEESQTVTLDYPDVNITLQIGNPVAEINGRAQTLLAAPELTGGYTMVPLRFISENFGAEVSYNELTEEITVIKSSAGSSGNIISGQIQTKYIGDSFYGWSMETPAKMQMDDRDFDGKYTSFAYDENNFILIQVAGTTEEYDFDDSFNEWKNTTKGLTLTKADKDTSSENKKSMHIQAKDKTTVYDAYEIATDKYIYLACGEFRISETDVMNEGLKILSTFDAKFSNEEILDLSNVENGVRRFEAESVKMSFDVPQDLIMVTDEYSLNSFVFNSIKDNDPSAIHACVYSKDSVTGALELAKTDYTLNHNYMNEKITKFSGEPVEVSYKNFSGYEYSMEITTKNQKEYSKDVFFELGEYVYNIRVSVNTLGSSKDAQVKKILDSVSVTELDFEQTGTFLRNDGYESGTITVSDIDNCKFDIPATYTQVASGENKVAYSNGSVILSATKIDGSYTARDLRTLISGLETDYNDIKGVDKINSIKEVSLGGKKYLKFTVSRETDYGLIYMDVYATNQSGNIYVFEITYDEIAYSAYARNEFEKTFADAEYK